MNRVNLCLFCVILLNSYCFSQECHSARDKYHSGIQYSVPLCGYNANLFPNGDFPQNFTMLTKLHNGRLAYEEECPCYSTGEGKPAYIYYVTGATPLAGYWQLGAYLGDAWGISYVFSTATQVPMDGWLELCGEQDPKAVTSLMSSTCSTCPNNTYAYAHQQSFCCAAGTYGNDANECEPCPSSYSAQALSMAFANQFPHALGCIQFPSRK